MSIRQLCAPWWQARQGSARWLTRKWKLGSLRLSQQLHNRCHSPQEKNRLKIQAKGKGFCVSTEKDSTFLQVNLRPAPQVSGKLENIGSGITMEAQDSICPDCSNGVHHYQLKPHLWWTNKTVWKRKELYLCMHFCLLMLEISTLRDDSNGYFGMLLSEMKSQPSPNSLPHETFLASTQPHCTASVLVTTFKKSVHELIEIRFCSLRHVP